MEHQASLGHLLASAGIDLRRGAHGAAGWEYAIPALGRDWSGAYATDAEALTAAVRELIQRVQRSETRARPAEQPALAVQLADRVRHQTMHRMVAGASIDDQLAPDAKHPDLLRLDADRDVVYRTWRLAANRMYTARRHGIEDRQATELWQILNHHDPLNVPIVTIEPESGSKSAAILRSSTGVPVATRAQFLKVRAHSSFPSPAGNPSQIVIAGQAYNKTTVAATIRSLSRFNPMYFPDDTTWLPLADPADGSLAIVSLSHSQARLLERQLGISESNLFEAEYVTGRLGGAPEELEQRAVETAKKLNRFFRLPGLQPAPEQLIRLYRGVAPRGIGVEFAGPLNAMERALFDSALESLMKMQQLSSDERRVLEDLQYRALYANAKFFSDVETVAMDHAEQCVMYYLDLPHAVAARYQKANRQAQNAFALPHELARDAKLYAVGPSAPIGVSLRPS